MTKKQNYLDILRSIQKKIDITQRKMATNLGFSLGKLSYCLKSLQQKGFVKINNFKRSERKIGYIYKLTPSGISEKNKTYNKFYEKKDERIRRIKKRIRRPQRFEIKTNYWIIALIVYFLFISYKFFRYKILKFNFLKTNLMI